ncbi:MAG: hybrid sensor histidine kinase/response regulator transcription factor, partial [Bacteroidia bacterium]
KSNSQRNYLILSGVGLLVLLLLLFFYLKYQKGKRQKAKIEDYNAQLTEISKVKNRFFTNIAHELRTPITLLMGPLEFVQSRNNDLSRESKMMVDLAYENATKLSTKVDEILELSNLENNRIRISPMRINLKDFFNGIYTLYKASAEFKGLGMKLDYDDDSDSLFITDEKHLETIVTNVLSNALKHAPDHSEIELKVSRRSGVLSVGVSDRGGKLTPKQQSKIFDSFFQTERGQEVGGFGIGLALSKQLALILNGDIEVDVAKDVRTTFTLIIPELEIVNESQEVEETSEGFTPVADIDFASQPTVLIVEDKVEMRAYLRQILKSDFKLLETDDGAEVMDILEYNAVDAIVCDLMMPKMRGEDIVELVKADPSTKGIPILILSAKDNLDAKLELFERGVADFITKPFSSQELIARLHRSLVMERKPQDKVDDFTYSNADDLWLNKVKDYVTQNVSNSSLKVSDIADIVGMVERTFRRKLKSLTGHSPLDFVKEIRLNHAYNLLKNNSHQTVKEVAHASGFNRSDFFTKEFKKRFGKVPKDIV